MLETIYLTRHGFRSNWVTDNQGNYSAIITSPTGIPSDPPLASHGEDQARELAAHLVALDPKIERIYSSPFYRCLQSITPISEMLDLPVLADNGFGEWYGTARFDHPSPASPELLHQFFPRLHVSYNPSIIPSSKGETVDQIHDRTAYALAKVIADIDKQWIEDGTGPKAILICTHGATNIAAGRALTGKSHLLLCLPPTPKLTSLTISGDQNLDVKTGTCSLSIYRRRHSSKPPTAPLLPAPSGTNPIPDTNWRNGNGVGGGWDIIVNGDCSFLTNGEERNWWFSGEEAWDYGVIKEAPDFGGPGTVPVAGKMEASIKEEAKI